MADQEQPSSGPAPKGDSSLDRSFLAELGNILERLIHFHQRLQHTLENRKPTSAIPDLMLKGRSQVGKNPERGAWLTRWEASRLTGIKYSELGTALYHGWFDWKHSNEELDSPSVGPHPVLRRRYLLLKEDVLEYKQLRDQGRATCHARGPRELPPRPGARQVGKPVSDPHPIHSSLASPMTSAGTHSFAAICDGRPDDQIHRSIDRLHTVAILQDQTPDHLIALANRISARLEGQGLRTWAGRAQSYRRRFAEALLAELPSTGVVHLYEARESEITACLPQISQLLPTRAAFTVHHRDGQPTGISVKGRTTNQRTQQVVLPHASYPVGVVVCWTAVAIASLYAHAEEFAIQQGLTPPVMILLPDRFPLDDRERPGATSLLRAMLHYQLGDRIHQQYAGLPQADNPAETLIDNIVGLFHQRHDESDSEASQLAFRMLAEPALRDHLLCERLNANELRTWR